MDCTSCPSFVATEDVPLVFKKHTGTPMCARYAIPLGRPGNSETSNATIRQHFAMECDSFMQERPERPVETRSYVMDPDPSIIAEFTDPSFVKAELTSCRQCTNLIRPEVVASEIGFPVELCRAKGKLVLTPQSECKQCPFAKQGDMSTSTDGLEIRPVYTEGFRVSTEAVAARVYAQGNTDVDPSEYVSDIPVPAENAAQGIRAYRSVQSPYGRGEIYLPIFNPEAFPEELRSLIPQTGDKDQPEQYVDYQHLLWDFAANCYMLEEALCMQGIPGVGKTEGARFFAWLMQLPFVCFNFNNDSEVEDLLGSPQYSPERGTYFELGRIPKAFGTNCIVLNDELNAGPHSVRQVLRPVFAKGTEMVIDASPPIRIQRAPYNYQLVAQNAAHDVRNTGVVELAGAEFDRLTVVNVDLPPDPVERHIIAMRCNNDDFTITDHELDKVMAIAADIRTLAADGVIPFTWGIRQQIKVARKLPYYPLVEAYKRAALDFYEAETAALILDSIGSFG